MFLCPERAGRRRVALLPLGFADTNEEVIVRKVGGTPEVKKHLENLGFVPGSPVMILNRVAGNLIVKVKESRIAINEEMARKIMI
jgi:ferrous iron transport protein A